MKKIAKMSLVAAVAVAGLTNANAGALEDAIKNTSILGYATFRYDDRNRDDNTGSNDYSQNNTKIALGLVSKITEDISYTYVGAIVGGSDTSNSSGDTAFGGVDGYHNGNIYTVYNNFTYTGFTNTSIIFGTQGLNVPQTDVYDTISGTQEGTGIAAVTTLGPVTLVGAYMNETNLFNGDQVGKLGLGANEFNKDNLIVLQAMGKFAGVSLDATYIDVQDVLDSYSIGAKASVDLGAVKLSPFARYTQLELDGATTDNELWAVGTKFKAGIVGGKLVYAATGKDGGFVAVDTDAEAAFQGWATQINGNADADTIQTNLNIDLMTGVNFAINYNTLSVDSTNTDTDEVYGQLTYKPAKNFMAYLRYGQVDYEGSNDGERGRIHVQYTF